MRPAAALASIVFLLPAPGGAQVIREGRLYREASRPEVYIISSGKKVWIPTPDALSAMGFNWSSVRVVRDGRLASFPRVNIPSSSPTPGSLVFPPNRQSHFPLDVVPSATRVISRGKELRIAELYGWIRAVDDGCGDGSDFHYAFELDSDWAIAQGIDLNRIFRVGNIATVGQRLAGFSPRRAVALPLIEVELNSWGWRGDTVGRRKPADWTFVGNCGLTFPFNHNQPPGQPAIGPLAMSATQRGAYVRISGSLVTDSPHDVQTRPNVILSRWFAITDSDAAEWEGAVPDWHPGVSSSSSGHFARWTEIHPPDRIEVLPPKDPRVTVRGVALAARVGALPGGISNSCEEAEFDIFPEASRPSGATIGYEELRGPEIRFPWGEDANNGSWISVFDDHVRVKARVCGGAIGGSPGRFKAIYRVWWKPATSPGATTRSGSFVTSDRDEIRYLIEPNAVGSDVVEFKLCLGPGLTWEKRLNMPDGQGSAWDIIVKDNTRCTTNSLWAAQVNNGQSLTFSKAKFLGAITQVHSMPLGSFLPLPGGTRLTFTWIKDT